MRPRTNPRDLAQDVFNDLNESAASAHMVKTAFLANMSHEMRTPLTVILGFADILKRPSLSEELRNDYLGRIERNGQQLLSLIEDLLDLAKIEAGQLCVRREETDFRAAISAVIEKYRPLAEGKNIVLAAAIDEAVPGSMLSSPARLRQILDNLVSNAIKFTESGSVQVVVKRDRELLMIDVIDTGIGIADEMQDNLFQPFSQVDNSRTRAQGGTGIGLILSKRISELLGGELTLKHSQKALGTTFTLTLPGLGDLPMTTSPAKQEKQSQRALEGIKLLVAEDVIDNQDLFRIVLESAGASVEIVSNGEEAVQRACEDKFDAILMDVQMPLLDGLSATRKIRSSGGAMPIIALTAHAMPEEVAKSKAAGCDDHVSKPITTSVLVAAILRHIALRKH